ncbi:MAG: PAS domain-containing sensor histidine kinase [Desulfovibrio sp. S3730MH75]|nr:MAG: PAS domain-containing sensor histidine kinase [Desulfovibrio sp. S3730MH75]
MLCALLLTFWFYYGTVAEELTSSSGQSTSRLLNFVRGQISKSNTDPGSSSFQKTVTELGHDLGIRITYIMNGKVLADSEVQENRLSKLDDHSNRPEVIAAEASGSGENVRYSTTLETRMLYVAKAMRKDGEFLRLAMPYSVIGERLARVKLNFALVLLLIAAGSALLLIYIGKRTSAAVTEISATATAIGEGDYSKRIRVLPGGEYKLLANSINTMARKIQGHIRTIEDQKNKLDAMFENMKEGIMVLDPDGKIESVNNSMIAIIPETANSKGRMPLEVLTRHEIQDSVDAIISNRSESKSDSIILDFSDGRSMNVTICSFNDSENNRKLILVFHDISEVRRIEMVLRDFVSNASHQLRTPLTSIKGYTETIIDNPPSDNNTLSKFLNIILDNANHMSKVITGMFALARSEYSGKKLRSEPTNLKQTIIHSINNLNKQAGSKEITITIGQIVEDLVVGTDEGLIQIFENILENAIKYAPEKSGIKIETESDGSSVTTKVIDEGPGITSADAERIFERFFKLDENAVENGSSGLGLAICRSLVRNFNGDIWVESPTDTASGTGSSFCVKLPVAAG